MEEYRAWIILGCVAAFFAMCIGVGLWAMHRTKSASDFFMAGRDLGFIVTAVAVFSSTMSGFGFVGGPGLVYQMGMSSAWMIVCTGLSYTVCFFLLAKRLRILAEVRESISLPDAVQARYGSRLAGFLTAVAILLGVLGYLGTQILAMATVMQQVLAGVLPGEISLPVCAFISVGLLVFYCVTGGIIASVYTDLAQGLIMMIAALLVFFAVIASVEGGFAGMSETILQDDKGAMSPWGTKGMFGALSWYFVFSLGIAGQPQSVQTRHAHGQQVGTFALGRIGRCKQQSAGQLGRRGGAVATGNGRKQRGDQARIAAVPHVHGKAPAAGAQGAGGRGTDRGQAFDFQPVRGSRYGGDAAAARRARIRGDGVVEGDQQQRIAAVRLRRGPARRGGQGQGKQQPEGGPSAGSDHSGSSSRHGWSAVGYPRSQGTRRRPQWRQRRQA